MEPNAYLSHIVKFILSFYSYLGGILEFSVFLPDFINLECDILEYFKAL